MLSIIHLIKCIYFGLTEYISPFFALGVRLWMAKIFFDSGLVKIKDMENTILLFEDYYNLPYVSPEFAAYSAATVEILCPILLTIGLFSRIAAAPIFVMAIVIQFVLGAQDSTFYTTEHFYWMFLVGYIILHGPGKISLDHIINKKYLN